MITILMRVDGKMNRPFNKLSGFQCPRCKSMKSKVEYTSAYGKQKYRERTCKTCGHSYTTLETVVKDEGTRAGDDVLQSG